MTQGAWLVVGLGNPGPTYAAHRHNVGHMVVDVLADRMGAKFRPHPRGRAEVVEGRLGPLPGTRIVLAKARAYMNESGGPVASLMSFYKLAAERLVVVHDELDIAPGALRLKFGGGDGGHRGLRSIRQSLSTADFYRVRVGIGRPPGRQEPADFVLSPFSSTERKELPFWVDRAADAVEALVHHGLEAAQNTYHTQRA